jgi:hypothetical protein
VILVRASPLQTSVDYSQALNQIVEALNRPTIPQWEIAIIGALTGGLGAIFVQLFLRWFENHSKRRDMRRAICCDLVEMFWALYWIQGQPLGAGETGETHRLWQEQQVRGIIRFSVEKFAHDNPSIYFRLAERGAAETIYRALHQLLDSPNWLQTNLAFVTLTFARSIQNGHFSMKAIRDAVGEDGADRLWKETSKMPLLHLMDAITSGADNADGGEDE